MVFFQLRPSDSFKMQSEDAVALRRTDQDAGGVGTLGVKLFLASLAFLFAGTLVLYLVTLVPAERPEQPVLPVVGLGLAISTLVMLGSSFTYWLALRAIRADDRNAFRRMMTWTFVLGTAFLAAQSFNWWQMIDAGLPFDSTNRHSALFVALTVLHALHVVGGVIPLGVVTGKARRGDYTSTHHEGVVNVALYWHFLDVVWVIMLVAIVAVTG